MTKVRYGNNRKTAHFTIPNTDIFHSPPVIYRSATNPARKYTYAEVKSAATQFGEGLCNLWDWQRGEVLNIYAPNDIDIGPIIFGVFFAGGIVSPANPGYSADELGFQLKNSESKAIVTTKAFLAAATKAAQVAGIAQDRIILLGEEKDQTYRFKHWTSIRKTSGAQRYRRRKAKDPRKDLAFLVYSSGTTGKSNNSKQLDRQKAPPPLPSFPIYRYANTRLLQKSHQAYPKA